MKMSSQSFNFASADPKKQYCLDLMNTDQEIHLIFLNTTRTGAKTCPHSFKSVPTLKLSPRDTLSSTFVAIGPQASEECQMV